MNEFLIDQMKKWFEALMAYDRLISKVEKVPELAEAYYFLFFNNFSGLNKILQFWNYI